LTWGERRACNSTYVIHEADIVAHREATGCKWMRVEEDGMGEVFPLIDGTDEEAEWTERALCAQTDPEAFFPEKGGSTREAKKVCLSCDVRGECLDYALAHDERFGIWGGLSERERRRLKKSAV
jgi:WhiB family redox-sensing transcriptional regulator